jgi:hypothetical protein
MINVHILPIVNKKAVQIKIRGITSFINGVHIFFNILLELNWFVNLLYWRICEEAEYET